MTRVIAQISMSLDGFVAGLNDGPANPIGDHGESLHEWVIELASRRRQHRLDGGEENPASALVEAYIAANVLDELHLHIVPVFLGGGVRLFDRLEPRLDGIEKTRQLETPGVTHLTYRFTSAASRPS